MYQECLEIELALQEIAFVAHGVCSLSYKGRALKHTYEPDFICFDKIIVEIKAVEAIADAHRAQIINYLHATGRKVGLLVNFGHHLRLEYERFALSAREHVG